MVSSHNVTLLDKIKFVLYIYRERPLLVSKLLRKKERLIFLKNLEGTCGWDSARRKRTERDARFQERDNYISVPHGFSSLNDDIDLGFLQSAHWSMEVLLKLDLGGREAMLSTKLSIPRPKHTTFFSLSHSLASIKENVRKWEGSKESDEYTH